MAEQAVLFQKKKKSGRLHEPVYVKPEIHTKEEFIAVATPANTPGENLLPPEPNGLKRYVERLDSSVDFSGIPCDGFGDAFEECSDTLRINFYQMLEISRTDPSIKPYLAVTCKALDKLGDDFACLLKDNIKK